MLAALTTLLLVSGVPAAADPPDKPGGYLEYDAATNTWKQIPAPEPGTAEGDLAIAEYYLKQERYAKARRAFQRWFKNYGEHHDNWREAAVGYGQALLGGREYYKAHKALRPVMLEFGTDELTLTAAELETRIAEVFLGGTRRKWLGMRILPAQDLGISILDDIATQFPGTEVGERAWLIKADYYFDRGDFDLAEDEYGHMLAGYPRSYNVRRARLRRAQAALAQFPGTPFDDAPLVEAEERFQRFQIDFPEDAQANNVSLILEDIRNRRAQKEFEIGQYYRKVKHYPAARFYFEAVVNEWGGTVASRQAEAALQEIP